VDGHVQLTAPGLGVTVEDVLRAVLGPHANDAVPLEGGTRSSAFRHRRGIVLRISERVGAGERFENERAALALLGRVSDVRCPAVVDSGRHGPFFWQMTTLIQGPSVASLWPNASSKERRWFVDAAAQTLADVHRLGLPFFGDFVGPRYASTEDLLAARLAHARAEGTKAGRFEPLEFDALASRVTERARAIPAVKEFRHGDFHFGNLLFVDRDLAVVDFEWAGGGCGVADLAIDDYQEEVAAESPALLQTSYCERIGVDRDAFQQSLFAARALWKLLQASTRRSPLKAVANKAELLDLLSRRQTAVPTTALSITMAGR